MNDHDAYSKLSEIGQEHLLAYWDQLTQEQQQLLLKQIEELDASFYQQQKKMVTVGYHSQLTTHNSQLTTHNSQLTTHNSQLHVGCLVVAGGQGTRLRFNGPKGMFPIIKETKKSLFQLLAERVKRVGHLLHLAIMTSPLNHEQTVSFFEEHGFFGLAPTQIDFFTQGMLPFLDDSGNLFLETPYRIAEGPDGNGSSLIHFVKSGIWDRWRRQGVRYLNFIPIDNPLADPFDEKLVGFHDQHGCDITVKCMERLRPDEDVGVVVRKGDTVSVIEYSELSDEERKARQADGSLKYRCANISLFCFSMDFVGQAVKELEKKPQWHLAYKTALHLDSEGKTVMAKEPMAWKFERFIFDVLPLTKKIEILLYPREECYAPLKNQTGENSVATVQKALQRAGIE